MNDPKRGDKSTYQNLLRRRDKVRPYLKETDPLTRAEPLIIAEAAFNKIKSIRGEDSNADYQGPAMAVRILIAKLMGDEELRDVVLASVEPAFQLSPEDVAGKLLTSEIVQAGFASLSESYENAKAGSPGRRPERVDRIYAVFKGRELDSVPLDDFVAVMPETVKNPREQVPSDIAKINSDFRRFDIPLLIEGKSYGRKSDRKTFYQILYCLDQ